MKSITRICKKLIPKNFFSHLFRRHLSQHQPVITHQRVKTRSSSDVPNVTPFNVEETHWYIIQICLRDKKTLSLPFPSYPKFINAWYCNADDKLVNFIVELSLSYCVNLTTWGFSFIYCLALYFCIYRRNTKKKWSFANCEIPSEWLIHSFFSIIHLLDSISNYFAVLKHATTVHNKIKQSLLRSLLVGLRFFSRQVLKKIQLQVSFLCNYLHKIPQLIGTLQTLYFAVKTGNCILIW